MQKINTQIQQYWRLSRACSRPYLIAQSLVFCVMSIEMVSGAVILGPADSMSETLNFVFKGLIESMLFITLSHFIVRGYLKTQFVPKGINLKKGIQLFILLLTISILDVAANISLDTSGILGLPSTERISVVIDGKEKVLDIHSPIIWSIATLNQFAFYLIWTLGYIFWHSTKSKRELQKQMQEVRIQQLTNQLNPHFLFNAFNSIRAMIFEDKEKAADLVTQLSELFRTHLQAHLQPTATLEEEWRIAQQYLDIEKVRIEERMQVSSEFDAELAKQKLPTLTLLTLIENAVKHGISPNAEQGHIAVFAKIIDDTTWFLEIKNSYLNKSNLKGTGTGLKNTRQRLQLMYGELATLQIENQDNCFIVRMELPLD